MEEEEDAVLRRLRESLDSHPDNSSVHFDLGVFLWEKDKESREVKEKAAEHFVISAKLNPQNGPAFRYLGHYYSRVSSDSQRAVKCYQRAVSLNPNDSESGEAICDLLDQSGKESLEISLCREASDKSPRAFWAFRRLGYLQVHQNRWSEAVQSLQHAIRGYLSCADLWEALGLSYHRLGMFTAAVKSYGRAMELDDSRVFASIESGNILLMLGSFRKGIEHFQKAVQISPQNLAAHYGLASALFSLSKECIDSGAFSWGASLLEEAAKVAKVGSYLGGSVAAIWKLYGDIQLTYAKCFPWMEEGLGLKPDENYFSSSVLSWRRTRLVAAMTASRCYQRALHLSPWQANIYVDIAITSGFIHSFERSHKQEPCVWKLPEKMSLAGLLLEGGNNDFWVALGCLSTDAALKQHAFIRALHLDMSSAVAWAYLGQLYRKMGNTKLAQQAFDGARSVDPSLALPWAGMSADSHARKLTPDDAYECCLRAVQIMPLAEFQIGLAKFAMLSGHLSSSEVYGAIRQSLQRAPHYPESHNLNGLVSEAHFDYEGAVVSYRLALCAMNNFADEETRMFYGDVSINLARSLCLAGNAIEAVKECEDLKEKGLLNYNGLQIYALSLWQLGKNDLALSVARNLAATVKSMEEPSRAVSICFICKLIYSISGQESAIGSILKMPKELFQNSKVCFVLSAIHALDKSNLLDPVVSSSHYSLISDEEITRMHYLIALGKLIKHQAEDFLDLRNGTNHLQKAIHLFPNCDRLRSLLSYLLLISEDGKNIYLATRCMAVGPLDSSKEQVLKSASEVLGSGVVACYTTGKCNEKFSFPTCKDQCQDGSGATQQLQRSLHQEPWNHNTRYLLILSFVQKAREERYPQHLCTILERLFSIAFSNQVYLNDEMSYKYQKFQLFLCAAEVSLQAGNQLGCIKHALSASRLSLPHSYLFFVHLQLCRAYAAEDNISSLHEEYTRCLDLKTDHHIGWLCLQFIGSRFNLQKHDSTLALSYEECSKGAKSWNNWMALFNLVQGLIAVWKQDSIGAEKFLAQACALADRESCLFLCHGAICMELARRYCDQKFLSAAIRSLRKAQETSFMLVPIGSLLLAQAEASHGSKAKWEKNLRLEWFSWPSELRPAEIFFQMHLLSKQLKDVPDSHSSVEYCQSPLNWTSQPGRRKTLLLWKTKMDQVKLGTRFVIHLSTNSPLTLSHSCFCFLAR